MFERIRNWLGFTDSYMNYKSLRAEAFGYQQRLHHEPLEDRRMLATLTVSVNSDGAIANNDGNLTLREAVAYVNGADQPGPNDATHIETFGGTEPLGTNDTILFDSTLSGDTIALALSEGELYLVESVIIDGANQGITIDAGNGTDGNPETFDGNRIFEIFGFGNQDVEINGLTLTRGDERLKGGAIRSEQANLTLRNTTITGNSSSGGGAIYFDGYGNNLNIISSTISNNSIGYGGKLGGGALITGTDSSIVISGTTFSENTVDATEGNGGGLFLSLSGSGSSVDISDTTISGNQALGSGTNAGGMYLEADGFNVTLDRLQVHDNEADDDGGGLMLFNSGGEVQLRNSTITGNTARDNDSTVQGGGGLVINTSDGAETIVENSTIAFNDADERSGGGIFIESGYQTAITILNTTISGNLSGRNGGGIKFSEGIDGGSVDILHSTITNNRADSDGDSTGVGGGIHMGNSSTAVNLDHTIVAGNFNGMGATRDDISGAATIEWSLIGDDTGATLTEVGTGNQRGTSSSPKLPMLGPLQNNGGPTMTHALLPGSPAIDMGDPSFSSSTITTDQRGEGFDRVFGGRIDIGAFEVGIARIVDVEIDGTSWTRDPFSFAELVPAGQQLRPIATQNVNTIRVHFSEAIQKKVNGTRNGVSHTADRWGRLAETSPNDAQFKWNRRK